MNLELLDSFGQNYPEAFDGFLDCYSSAVTCVFNEYGTLLAVGCNDGRIVIWDFLTRGIAKIISAHIRPVCSLSWSKNGRKLLSASADNVCTWDVLSGEREGLYILPSVVLKVQYHPRMKNLFLVCSIKHATMLIDTKGDHKLVPIAEDSDLKIVASFDRRGEYIYTGNACGKILVLTCPDLEVKVSFKVSTEMIGITTIEFPQRGDCFLLNCSDRVIRVYDAKHVLDKGKEGEPEPIQKFKNLVNRALWKKCCFSGDGEYVCAGSAKNHTLYIWEKCTGHLVKILYGTKRELFVDVVWHPIRAIIISISSGVVSVWARDHVENLSVFVPDFKELDENVEYEERESEFDLEDEDKSIANDIQQSDEDFEVDVESIEPVAALYCSDEEGAIEDDEEPLIFLPISPNIEDADMPPSPI